MTRLALRVVLSSIFGILVFDSLNPYFLPVIFITALSFLLGFLRKELFYLTIFLLSGLNYASLRKDIVPFHRVIGCGDVLTSRPYYGRYLVQISTGVGSFEAVCRKDLKGRRVYFEGVIKKDEKSKIRLDPIHIVEIGRVRPPGSLFEIVRDRIKRAARIIEDRDCQGLFVGLLLGRNHYPAFPLWGLFARAGIIHLLTVSGLHVGFIFSLGLVIFLLLGINRRWSHLLALLLIPFYAGVTGFRPPVVRASIMLGMLGISKVIERKVPTIHFLILALLFLIIIDPTIIFNPGAQLSFTAAFGIILIYNEFKEKLPKYRIQRYLGMSLLISVAAVLATGPILAFYFGRIPVLSPITNLIVVPTAWVSVGLGIITVIIHQGLPGLAEILTIPLGVFLRIIIMIGRFVGSIPFGSFEIGWLPVLIFPFYYLAFIKKLRTKGLICLLIIANLFIFLPKSYRLTIEGGRIEITPPGIELSQLFDKGPVEIKIGKIDIRKIENRIVVIFSGKEREIDGEGVYHLTPSGILKEERKNLLIQVITEIKLLYYRLCAIGS
ncbi:MAG TPA: ComEC/Rec2 family competence protein [bacterium (Candidatus Stahlbacteria)]|nr:ComEC/Rec2 family competence protein [Candidatus Stahlbacteria bacterium]